MIKKVEMSVMIDCGTPMLEDFNKYGIRYLLRTPVGQHLSADFHALWQALQIGPDSTVLLFNTEGATDPESYREILWHGHYPHHVEG